MAFDWLETLEARVREAADRLVELRDENRALRSQVEELETRIVEPALPFESRNREPGDDAPTLEELEVLRRRIEELEGALEQAQADRDEARGAADRYGEEREEIRKRIEALTARLEGLTGG